MVMKTEVIQIKANGFRNNTVINVIRKVLKWFTSKL